MNLPWGAESDINISLILECVMQKCQKGGDLKLKLAFGVQTPHVPHCQSLSLPCHLTSPDLTHLWDEKEIAKFLCSKMIWWLISNNSFFDSYHAFKIQVVTLWSNLHRSLINDSTRYCSISASIWCAVKIPIHQTWICGRACALKLSQSNSCLFYSKKKLQILCETIIAFLHFTSARGSSVR